MNKEETNAKKRKVNAYWKNTEQEVPAAIDILKKENLETTMESKQKTSKLVAKRRKD